MTKGWIKIERAIKEHWTWQEPKVFHRWMTILLEVNHSSKEFPVGNELFTCYPGQSFKSINEWSRLFKCAKKTTLAFFKMLEDDSMIKREIIGKGNRRKHLLTVVNWNKYQQMETETKPETTPKRNPNVPPNKNDKNGKNDKRVLNKKFTPPTLNDIQKYFTQKVNEKGLSINPINEAEKFESFYSSKGWYVGKNKMKDWKKSVSGWIARSEHSQLNGKQQPQIVQTSKGMKR